jgi:3-dehydroquinate synthetase
MTYWRGLIAPGRPGSASLASFADQSRIRDHLRNCSQALGNALELSLRKAKVPYQVLEMDDGEPAKRLSGVEQLAEQMVDSRADREAMIVAFGGGVVGDPECASTE